MARKRASMREGPLAELFKATEAAQRQAEEAARQGGQPEEPQEATVEHVPTWEDTSHGETPAVTPPPAPTPWRPPPPVQPEIPVSQPVPPPPPAPAVPEPRYVPELEPHARPSTRP